MDRLKSALIVPGLLAMLAACGGAPAVPGQTGSGTSPGASGALASTAPGAATSAPASTTGMLGGPTSAPPAAGMIEACQILTDADIMAATFEAVTSRTKSTLTQVFPSVCDIELDGGGSITLGVKTSGGRSMYETSFEPFISKDDPGAPLDEAVVGLGDKAGRSGDGELMVLKDDILFDIHFIEYLRQDTYEVVEFLARSVLARIACLQTAGCAGMTPLPAPSKAAGVDACALLTNEEIKAATSFDVTGTEAAGGGAFDPGCTWTLNTGSAVPGSNYVRVELKSSGGRSQFDFLATAYDPPLEHIAGMGDDAIKTGTIPDGSVYAVVDDRLVSLKFSMPLSVGDPYALVVPLMPKLLARL